MTTLNALLILMLGTSVVFAVRDVKYRHFEDYLNSLDATEQAMLTEQDMFMDENEIENGSGNEGIPQNEKQGFLLSNTPLRTGLFKSKEVTCCSLGQLAGDKGYHCFVQFYAARIMLRNRNRAHNRKMAFHGEFSMPNYGAKIMRTFEQCVASRAQLFHKCCQLAAIERKSMPHYDSLQRRKFEQKRNRLSIPK